MLKGRRCAVSLIACLAVAGTGCVGERVPGGDDTPPRVVSTVPVDGQVDVAADITLEVVFTEALDPATVSAPAVLLREAGSGAVVASELEYSEGSSLLRLRPLAALSPGRRYEAQVLGSITDAAGNALLLESGEAAIQSLRPAQEPTGTPQPSATAEATPTAAPTPTPASTPSMPTSQPATPMPGSGSAGVDAHRFSFTVATSAPGLFASTPSDGDTGVAQNLDRIEVRFDQPMAPASVNTRSVLVPGVPGRLSYEPNTNAAVFEPTGPLPEGRRIEIILTRELRSAQGVPFLTGVDGEGVGAPLRLSFTTAAKVPALLTTNPEDGADSAEPGRNTITLRFDEALDPESVTRRAIRLLALFDGAVVPRQVRYLGAPGDESFVALIDPELPLLEGARYRVEVDATLRDLAGLTLAAPIAFEFGVASRAPQLNLDVTRPAPGSTELDATTLDVIEVVFDEALDPSTVTPLAIQLRARGTPVPGNTTHVLDPITGRSRLSFLPDAGFASDGLYSVSLDPSLADFAGTRVTGTLSYDLETADTPDNNPPSAPGAPEISSLRRDIQLSFAASADDSLAGPARGRLGDGHYRVHHALAPLAATALSCDEPPAGTAGCAMLPEAGGPTCCARIDRVDAFDPGTTLGPTLIPAPFTQPLYYALEAVDESGNRQLGPWTRAFAGPEPSSLPLPALPDEASERVPAALLAIDLDDDLRADLLAEGRPEAQDGAGLVRIWRVLSDGLDVAPLTVLRGGSAGDAFGAALSAGDFDTDSRRGRTTLIVGAPGAQEDRGAVYLFHFDAGGRPGGVSEGGTGDAAQSLFGAVASERFGAALATGLLNDDIHSDLAIAAPAGGANGQGRVVLVPGRSRVDGDETLRWDRRVRVRDPGGEPAAGSQFGFRLASGRSVGGAAGQDDLLIGTPWDDRGGRDTGSAVLLFGGSDLFPSSAPASVGSVSADHRFAGRSLGGAFGYAVVLSADTNGGNIGDLAIGAPGDGEGGALFVYHGRSGGPAPELATVLEGDEGHSIGTALDAAVNMLGTGQAMFVATSARGRRPDDAEASGEGYALVFSAVGGPFYLGGTRPGQGLGDAVVVLGDIDPPDEGRSDGPSLLFTTRGAAAAEELVLWR